MISFLRDEAHRFSRKLHHKEEKNRLFLSPLIQIKGLGKISLEKIRKSGITIEELKNLSYSKIKKRVDLSEKLIEEIKKYLDSIE